MDKLTKLNQEITRCRKCPRLVAHREAIAKNPPLRYRGQKYWARPLPGFGDPDARIYIIGLAPAANGGNRTGRIFTGDRSGDWLYGTLFEVGLANQTESVAANDGLKISSTYIGASVRCAPPDNKPTLQEFQNCHPYLERESKLLSKVRVIIALGSIAYNATKKLVRPVPKGFRFPPFGHARKVVLPDGRKIICSYHPSQQNTFTGKLTREMFLDVFREAKREAGL
ncbi:MAG: uracil-DNA glycosylase [Acidobacteria bacterium]|nr:MAG: uracil-DNA glycosylase [Acidobacteriota bacterium]